MKKNLLKNFQWWIETICFQIIVCLLIVERGEDSCFDSNVYNMSPRWSDVIYLDCNTPDKDPQLS